MRSKILKTLFLSLMIVFMSVSFLFAARLDENIPTNFIGMELDTDGKASFIPPEYVLPATINNKVVEISQWKRFEAQLLKRITIFSTGSITYTYKTTGGIKSCNADENEIEFTFPAVGYYQFQIRGVNLEGNYGEWTRVDPSSTYEGLPIIEDDIGISDSGTSSSNNSSSNTGSNVGPGTVQVGNIPYGYQYAVIGPNGEILGYYGNNASNYKYDTWPLGTYNYATNGTGQYYGPGFANNGQQSQQYLYPNTGISNYQQVESPYVYNGQNVVGNTAQINNSNTQPNTQSNNTINNQNSINNPNYSGQASGTPQITEGLELGWHIDNNGRYYYQGNGVVLKNQWYLIENNYYRFNDKGYVLANKWFKDDSTGYWYYLAGDGKMLTGWQLINDVWYYFKPENGNGYGSMYANAAIHIIDKTWGEGDYAFDNNGAMVKNAWYGGYFYGNDGRRTAKQN